MSSSHFEHRIFRCGQSHYYGDGVLHAHETHTPKRLAEIAKAGFNGVWIRGLLRELVPGALFGRYVRKSEERLKSLEIVCRRAKKVGLGVWLYCNEPLAIAESHPFWKRFGQLKGASLEFPQEFVTERGLQRALCSSTEPVQQFLEEGFYNLFQRLPLAGVILITASEHLTHCFSHVWAKPTYYGIWSKKCNCKRCARREPAEVLSEVITLIHRGITKAKPQAKVIAWDWSWNLYHKPPYAEIVKRLPKEVILMGDFERGLAVKIAGKNLTVEEYSLAFAGPSPRFRSEANLVQGKRPMMAKLQINTTHELATIPNLPLICSLYRKLRYLQRKKSIGYMACWNIGCWPDTLNVFAVERLSRSPFPKDEESFLDWLARRYFGPRAEAELLARAWRGFGKAMSKHYPFTVDFLYFSPINFALAYPLKTQFEGRPMGPAWLKHDWGDSLDNTLGPFTLDELVQTLGRLSRAWQKALGIYEEGLGNCSGQRARKELSCARMAGHYFESVFNVYSWYALRNGRNVDSLRIEIASRELANITKALPMAKKDPRFGYHQEAQCNMYNAESIQIKIDQLARMVRA